MAGRPTKTSVSGCLGRLVTFALFFALIGGVNWFLNSADVKNFFFDVEHPCEDYASAGLHVKPQLKSRDHTLYVSLKTSDYISMFSMGSEKLLNDIMREAVKYDGNPTEGERLGLIGQPEEIRIYEVGRDDDVHRLNVQIDMRYRLTKEQEKELKASVDSILRELDLDGLSDYEKIRAIYRYICTHVTYDDEHVNQEDYDLQYTAYAAAVNHTAVCAGVADLFYYLANTAGIEAHIKANDTHAWNFVRLGDRYYYLDATWDLGKGESSYEYFLKGKYDFNHIGGMSINLFGVGDNLKFTDEGYEFSEYAYAG